MTRTLAWQIALVVLSSTGIARGENRTVEVAPADRWIAEDYFQHGRYEATLTSGVLFSPPLRDREPYFDYTITSLQLGYMLSDTRGTGFFRGNFELAGEGFGSFVFKGDGSYLAGATLWVRFNFVPQHGRLVPFVQGGGGVTFTDIDRGVVGECFNFNLDLGAGVRCLLAPRWSANLELRFQHTSNAGLNPVNGGLNSWGPLLGVSCWF